MAGLSGMHRPDRMPPSDMKIVGPWSASSNTEKVPRFAADWSPDREIARPGRCPRRVALELKREMSPNAISSTPRRVAVPPRSALSASVMGVATGVALDTEEATVSLAEDAVAKRVSTPTGRCGDSRA